MRISRHSVGRRNSLAKNITDVLSRARRDGSNSQIAGTLLLFVVASIFIISASTKFLLPRSDDNSGRLLRATTGTLPTRVPKAVIEALKQFNPNDFKRKKLTPPANTSVILFYNLFIPDDAEGVKHAIQVITEQLGQVSSSLQKLEKKKRSAVLYYNLIGNERNFPHEKMQAICSKLNPQLSCEQIGYYETASESVTLQDIYDFCQNEHAVDSRITYIHSKGSYHQTEINTNWRRALTDSVVHPDCLFPPDDQCNVCGAQFYTRFSTMYPGNMWTAKCSYVKKLLPPLEGGDYDNLKTEAIVKFLKYRLWGQLNSTVLDDRIDYFGLGRYRLEHWIGSHPTVRPCELHRQNVTFASMITGDITPADYDWGMGPRRNEVVGEFPDARARIDIDEEAQFREYFFMPGHLLKWFTLYGAEGVPSQSSWAWKFIPAGEKWKQLVKKYGQNAVEEMVMQSSHGFHSAYAPNGYEDKSFQIDDKDEVALSGSKNPPIVVFYHIAIPSDKKLSALHALKTQLDVLVNGQYDIISRSYHRQRPVILYYTLAGDAKSTEFFTRICNTSPNLTCRKLGEISSATANNGETLHHLHKFCLEKPSQTVTYLTNQLPGIYGVNKTEVYSMQKIRAYTTAATSKMCLKSRDSCNVCGAEFYPLPYHHFIGNMFTATCDYVKDLLPPEKFESAMNDAASETLVSQLRGATTTQLFPFTPQNLGLDQYSVEHWIGSHPDFEPCDVAPVRHSWFPLFTGGSYLPNEYTRSQVYDFMWSQAPRRSSAPVGRGLDRRKERDVNEKDDVVFREYCYLAGNLFRWHKLYNKAPPWNSWVWQWYPKGEEWMMGAKKYSHEVVTKISKPYWDEGVPF